MDPVVRALSDVRRLKAEVASPFDRSELVDYLCTLAGELGFTPVKNLRRGMVRIDCGWKDGHELFLAANVEFGNEREILGAAAELIVSRPEMGLLITASNSLKPLSQIVSAVEELRPGFDVILLDINAEKAVMVRGRREGKQ